MQNLPVYLKTKDHFLSQEEFSLLYDETNDMLITYPRPDYLDRYYNSDAYLSHSDTRKGFLAQLYHAVKNISLKNKHSLIKSLSPKGQTVLDIGAGTGDFVAFLMNKGWLINGMEPNSNARKIASEKGVTLLPALDSLPGTFYDVITLWHVLEHIPNLKETIDLLTHKLKRGGHIIIAVPNYKCFDARFYKSHWAAYDTPRHLWHFSKKSIPLLFIEDHWNLVKIKSMPFDSFYVSLLSEKYKKTHMPYIRAFLIGFLSNLFGYFTKEYSSHVYILQKK
jgi:ubiquinone/menaquinone biosynthesis C-methylase UbiE